MTETKVKVAKVKLIGVGRGKVTRTIEAVTLGDVLAEASTHLASIGVDIAYDPKIKDGTIYAGFHTVGKFKVLNGELLNEVCRANQLVLKKE